MKRVVQRGEQGGGMGAKGYKERECDQDNVIIIRRNYDVIFHCVFGRGAGVFQPTGNCLSPDLAQEVSIYALVKRQAWFRCCCEYQS